MKWVEIMQHFIWQKKKSMDLHRFLSPTSGNRCLKVVVLVVVLFYLGRQDTIFVCGFFLFPPSPLYVCQKESRGEDGGWIWWRVCLAFSAWLALHNITQYGDSFSPAWDWGGFVLNGDSPLATARNKGKGNETGHLCFACRNGLVVSKNPAKYSCLCWRYQKSRLRFCINNQTV